MAATVAATRQNVALLNTIKVQNVIVTLSPLVKRKASSVERDYIQLPPSKKFEATPYPSRCDIAPVTSRRQHLSPKFRLTIRKSRFVAYSGPAFSIDAVLPRRISNNKCHASSQRELPVTTHQLASQDPRLFDIHEDTRDELAKNLVIHSVCILDISFG